MQRRIDLNSDLGEGFGPYALGPDEGLLAVISSANIACGFHAGDPRVMRQTVARAVANNVGIGAHPGYPDRAGFGRRALDATPDDIYTDVLYQLGALSAFCRAVGTRLRHVKPHGALYNRAMRDVVCAEAVAAATQSFDPRLIVMAQPQSALAAAAQQAGLLVALELFADRAVNPDGTLVPRHKPGAVISDQAEVIRRSLSLVLEGRVIAIDGSEIAMAGSTLCLHGDTPDALSLAQAIRRALTEAGVQIVAAGG